MINNKIKVFTFIFGLSAVFCFAEDNSTIDVNSSRLSRFRKQPRMLRNNENNSQMFKYSTTIEKERPQLDEETKKLISEYRKNPTDENYNALRKKVESNYDKALEKKKAKLEELKQTAKDSYKIDEMQEIVDEMVNDRENRINQSMSRFTDSRLRSGSREVKDDGYLPVLGAGQNVNIAYTPVTNEEYAKFIKDTGRTAPQNWVNGNFPNNKKDFPVVYISYNDAVEYCKWLSQKDGTVKYRLPTETEWELAAGHMPKDADFNSGKTKGLTSVNAYSKTPKYWRNGTYPNDKANHPVVFVSYNDAIAYCSWLETKHPEYTFRLPTVEEWEYAANGGKEYAFPWGNELDENCFNYNKIVATAYLEENPTVTYVNQKSAYYSHSLPLNKVISFNKKRNNWLDRPQELHRFR